MSAARQPAAFDGFGPDARSFLVGLEEDNSKAYFDTNRAIYDEHVAGPMKSFVVAVGERLADAVEHDLSYEPRVGRSLFRINRDLRFSKDKTPYQTHLDAIWWTGEVPKESPAFILRITSDEILTGAGMHGLRGEPLERYRDAIAGAPGASLAETVARLENGVGADRSEPSRKRVPKGYPADHERADLLVRDGFHVSVTEPVPSCFEHDRFASWATERLARFADLQTWFVRHV